MGVSVFAYRYMKYFLSFFIAGAIAITSVVIFARTFTVATTGHLFAIEIPTISSSTVVSTLATVSKSIPPLGSESPRNDTGYTKAVVVEHPTYPSRLSIPTLNIDTHVQRVGITALGAIGSPNNFKDVGWYDRGTIPGEVGGAVIDGHVDNALALAGVFKHLKEIKKDDHIFITTMGGKKLDFIVTDVIDYDYKEVPLADFLATKDLARLWIITCGGNWIGEKRTYDKRLVVSAVLVT